VSRTPRLLLALALIAAACGEAVAETTTTTAPTTTTTAPTTTTTTAPTTTTTTQPVDPVSPISGLPVEDTSMLDQRAYVIKVDNSPPARPQTGILEADGVIELSVEGITRLAVILHMGSPDVLGPVRSARPTDYQIAGLIGAPLVVSGGQDWVLEDNRQGGAAIIGDLGRPLTFRSSSRRAPHNLYLRTAELRDIADRFDLPAEAPQALWEFGPLPAEAESATTITMDFSPSLVAGWTWDGTRYLRTTNGVDHKWVDSEGVVDQIAADTLVVLFTETFLQSDPSGGPAQAVISIGSGRALVFAGGSVVEGRWQRRRASDPFTLTTEDGETLEVPPGFPWISLFPRDGEVSW
jgi:hypothetical protein